MKSRLIEFFKSAKIFMLRCKEFSLTWQLGRYVEKNKDALPRHDKNSSVEFSAEVKSKKEYLNNEIKQLLKEWGNDRDKILEYIQANGTIVLESDKVEKKLKLLKEEIGLILATKGIEAFKINLMLFRKIGFRTPNLFVVDSNNTDIYILIQQFHKWYFMKNGFSGYDKKSIKLLERLRGKDSESIYSKLNNKDITLLRQAIARDVESIEFVEQYARETAGAKNALEKMQNGGASI